MVSEVGKFTNNPRPAVPKVNSTVLGSWQIASAMDVG